MIPGLRYAVTTTGIEVRNIQFILTAETSSFTTFDVTSSVSQPMFTTTDDPGPERKSGVTHAPVITIITPPPYPYSPHEIPGSACQIQARASILAMHR